MSAHVAYILQGKNTPLVKHHLIDHNHFCIVVNTDKVLVTKNRLKTNKFYWHTGYPGGLKSIRMKEFLKKDSPKMIRRVIKGMLPKNEQMHAMMARLFIYKNNYHEFLAPQFGPQIFDPHKHMGLEKLATESTIIFSNKEIPPELKHVKVDIDPLIAVPDDHFEAVKGRGRKYIFAGADVETWGRRRGRYKTTRKFFE